MDTGHNLPMDRKKLEKCYLIYEQIFNDPKISIYALGKNTRMSRNTVFKYLKEMIAPDVGKGMNPHQFSPFSL